MTGTTNWRCLGLHSTGSSDPVGAQTQISDRLRRWIFCGVSLCWFCETGILNQHIYIYVSLSLSLSWGYCEVLCFMVLREYHRNSPQMPGELNVQLKRGSVPFGVRFLGTIMFFSKGQEVPWTSNFPLISLMFWTAQSQDGRQKRRKCEVHKTWEEHVSPLFLQSTGEEIGGIALRSKHSQQAGVDSAHNRPSSLFWTRIEARLISRLWSILASRSLNCWLKGKSSSAKGCKGYKTNEKHPIILCFPCDIGAAPAMTKDEDTPVLLILTVEGAVCGRCVAHVGFYPCKFGYNPYNLSVWLYIYIYGFVTVCLC